MKNGILTESELHLKLPKVYEPHAYPGGREEIKWGSKMKDFLSTQERLLAKQMAKDLDGRY